MQQNKPPKSISKICQQKKLSSISGLRWLSVTRENQGKWCKQEEIETGKGRGHSLDPMITIVVEEEVGTQMGAEPWVPSTPPSTYNVKKRVKYCKMFILS